MTKEWFDSDEEIAEILGESDAVEVTPVYFDEMEEGANETTPEGPGLELLHDIPLSVRAVLGSVDKKIDEILTLKEGEILETNRSAAELVDIMVEDQLIAKGEVVMVDNKFGVVITEIIPPKERIRSVETKLNEHRT